MLKLGSDRNETFRLEPRQRITSAIPAASAAPFQLRGFSRVPRSPKCTMVSLSSPPQMLHLRPVPWRCSDVRSVTSNSRTYSLIGAQEVHTCRNRETTVVLLSPLLHAWPYLSLKTFIWTWFTFSSWYLVMLLTSINMFPWSSDRACLGRPLRKWSPSQFCETTYFTCVDKLVGAVCK